MKLHHLVIRLWLGTAAFAFAQTTTTTPPAGPRHGGPGRGPGGHPVIRTLDADKDGVLSATELANAPTALKALDTDGDGKISVDELRPPRPANAPDGATRPTPPAGTPARPTDGSAPGAHPRPLDPVMLALDADQDGSLNAQEIANAYASLTALDLNKDGKLTPDEFRPLPPARPTGE